MKLKKFRPMGGPPFGSATESIFTHERMNFLMIFRYRPIFYFVDFLGYIIHIVCVIFNLLEYKISRSKLHSRPLVSPQKWVKSRTTNACREKVEQGKHKYYCVHKIRQVLLVSTINGTY